MTDPNEPIEPEELNENEELNEEDEPSLEEPYEASRLSPHAVACFIVGLLGLYMTPSGGFGFYGGGSWRVIPSAFVPLAIAAVTLWLAGRAAEEIYVADGRFGGVGFLRAGRALGIVTIIVGVLPLLFLAIDAAGLNFDV
jgi:hypothetical protein